jgi:hypothetical protein
MQVFRFDDPNYSIRLLQPEDAEALQRLLEQCTDYALLVEGEAVPPYCRPRSLPGAAAR